MLSGILALFIGAFSGSGFVPVVTKVGLQFAAPLVFVFFRFLFATLLFLPFLLFSHNKKLTKKDYTKFLILALLLFVNVTFFTIGVKYTTVIMSQMLYLPTPIVVVILAHFFLQERITKQKIVGLFIALCGVLFLLYQSAANQAVITFGTPLGNSIIIIAMLGYSGWVLYSRSLAKSQKYTTYQMTFYTFLFIALYLLVLLPFQKNLVPSQIMWTDPKGVIFAILVASISIIQYFFLQIGIKKTNAFTASLFQYVEPIFAGMVSIPLLHEKITVQFIIGGIIIFAGVFYATTFSYVKRYFSKPT